MMVRTIIRWSLALMIFCYTNVYAQTEIWKVKKSHVSFFSSTPIEDIEALCQQLSGAVQFNDGQFQFKIPIQQFEFSNRLMKSHFNESYMESDKYPVAKFVGQSSELAVSNPLDLVGKTIQVDGQLTIHGVARSVTIPVTFKSEQGQLLFYSKFNVRPADHKIKIPKVVTQKIAENIEVKLSGSLQK